MDYNIVSYEKRIKENIKNYAIRNLYAMDVLTEYLEAVAEEYGAEILLTDRHGEKAVTVGDFEGFEPDVVAEPGEKLRIGDRTVGHLYVRYEGVPEERRKAAERMVRLTMNLLASLGTEAYMHREAASYIDELEIRLENGHHQKLYSEKEDILTGVCNKNYLESRMQTLDRSEVVPVAVINVNINDWKFVYDNFGVEKSDNLIQIVASIVKKEAKNEYIIGRIDGDVFAVLIPMAEDGEAEDYCRRVQEACLAYEEDAVLAPSVAVGVVYKTNVEEHLQDKISDAEYEMFDNKLEIKNSPGYQERLKKGLKL
jgi:diguanylate cyclase (GGDEF) domain